MAKFRFQDLQIWNNAIALSDKLLDIADKLEEKRLYRFSDQLRGCTMSISNNIAESTGTEMKGEQRQLLRFAKRECFETVNILTILLRRNLIQAGEFDTLTNELDRLSRMISNYSKSLEDKT